MNRNSYTLCPMCGLQPIRFIGLPYLTCENKHKFYDCPICLDTRVKDKRENIFYCGMYHPYHLCPVHQIPVTGINNFIRKNCTCRQNNTLLLQTNPIKNWESPFM
jgi:hypothetical protein